MRWCAHPAILQAFPEVEYCREERESRSASPAAKAPAGAKTRQTQPQPPPGEPLRSRLTRSVSRLRARAVSGSWLMSTTLPRCREAVSSDLFPDTSATAAAPAPARDANPTTVRTRPCFPTRLTMFQRPSRCWMCANVRLCRAAGGELEQIQLLLGHASIQTT